MSTQVFLARNSGRITLKQLQNCLKTVLKNDPKNAPKRTTTHHNTAQHTQNTHNVHHEQLLRHVSTTYQHTYCVHLAVRLYYALHLAVRRYYALTFMSYVLFAECIWIFNRSLLFENTCILIITCHIILRV